MFSFLKRLGGPAIDIDELDALLAQDAIRVLDVARTLSSGADTCPARFTSR